MSRPKDINAPSRWNMRIWDDDRKEWLCQSDKDALTYYGFDITGGETTEFQGLPKWHPDRHLIWEQSTGRKDKNGIEIYGGDMVKSKKGQRYGFVEYIDDDSAFVIWWTSENEFIYLGEAIRKYEDLEVIGTIHENPELIGR